MKTYREGTKSKRTWTAAASVVGMTLAAWSVTGLLFAHDTARGSASTIDAGLTSAANWRILRAVSIIIPAGDNARHTCVATASADMDYAGPAGIENKYRFALSQNTPNIPLDTASERILELVNNGGGVNDPDSKPVATNLTFFNVRNDNGLGGSGTHRFLFLGRKAQAGDSNAAVLDSSFSVVCVDES